MPYIAAWEAGLKGSKTELPRPYVDLTGTTVIITGANAGLGKESANHLAGMKPAKLILAVRTPSKGDAAKAEIVAANPGVDASSIEVWTLDLANFASTKAFGQRVQTLPRLDVLIANAGIEPGQFEMTKDGWESATQVNVLSTWYLFQYILPVVQKTATTHYTSARRSPSVLAKPHISIVSSGLHHIAKFKEGSAPNILRALNKPENFVSHPRYMDTKVMEVHLVREFLKRHGGEVEGIIVNTSNPGWCHSGLMDSGKPGRFQLFMKYLMARPTEMGARAITWAGVLGVNQGGYCTNCVDEEPAPTTTSRKGQEIGARLYDEVIAVLEAVDVRV